MKLVVGLGNVGPTYARTRHNLGFMIIRRLAEQLEANWQTESKFMAEVSATYIGSHKIILAQPQTMMNLSGEAVRRLMDFYKLAPTDVWVIYDDLDVPFGRLRLRQGGGSSGHQGINSIIQHIGPDFVRARAGISLNDRTREPSEEYVLKPFTADEQTHLPKLIASAASVLHKQLAHTAPEEATFSLI